jgi:hypothetical protein
MSHGGGSGPASPRAAPVSPSRPNPIKRETAGSTIFIPVAVKREDNGPHHHMRPDHEVPYGSPSRGSVPTSSQSPFHPSRQSATPPPLPATSSAAFPSFPTYAGYHQFLAAHQAAAALLDPRVAAQLAAASTYPFPGLFHSPFASPYLTAPYAAAGGPPPAVAAPLGAGAVWTPPVATPTPPPPPLQRTPHKNEHTSLPTPSKGGGQHTAQSQAASYHSMVADGPDFRPREGGDGRPTYGQPEAAHGLPKPTHQQAKMPLAHGSDGEWLSLITILVQSFFPLC